VGVVGET